MENSKETMKTYLLFSTTGGIQLEHAVADINLLLKDQVDCGGEDAYSSELEIVTASCPEEAATLASSNNSFTQVLEIKDFGIFQTGIKKFIIEKPIRKKENNE